MININYDSIGKPQLIHIQINDYWALIPWNYSTQSIDWTQITYPPQLESLQSAWNFYLVNFMISKVGLKSVKS